MKTRLTRRIEFEPAQIERIGALRYKSLNVFVRIAVAEKLEREEYKPKLHKHC
jgi:hypothetical protein